MGQSPSIYRYVFALHRKLADASRHRCAWLCVRGLGQSLDHTHCAHNRALVRVLRLLTQSWQHHTSRCARLRALLTYLHWCLVRGSCALTGMWMRGVAVSLYTALLGLNIDGPDVRDGSLRCKVEPTTNLYMRQGPLTWSLSYRVKLCFYLKTTS